MSGRRAKAGWAAGPPLSGRALVMFSGRTDLKRLAWLKPGFRHCFAAVECDRQWVLYNPLSHATEVALLGAIEPEALAAWYRDRECRVVPWVRRPAPPRPAPVGLYTCVEAVKRLLGIHARLVLTPWNLYNFLKNTKYRK
ncbi:MAG TPA: hypothetical protein VGA19_11060 [Rhodospirillales bacterium]